MRGLIFLALVPWAAWPSAAEPARPAAPSVSLSAPIVISLRPVRQSAALLDAGGDAHLIVVAKSGALEHYRLHASEIGAHEIIDASPHSGAVSAAFDAAGVLNVALGGRLYAAGPSGWTRRTSAPECGQLARAGSTLVCAYMANNTEPGHRGKWNFGVLLIGGGMGAAALPYAWFQRNHLLMVARESSADHWDATVLGGPGDLTDAEASYALAGASDGVVHVLYNVDNLTRFMAAGSRSEVLYARLPPLPPSSAEVAGQSTAAVIGAPLHPYVPARNGYSPSCIEPLADGTHMLLLVASDSPYVADSSGEPLRERAAVGLRCYAGRLTGLVGFHADAADAVHLLVSIDHRDSLWLGAKYYDLCYQYRSGGGSTQAIAIGRRSSSVAASVSIVGDGHGAALVMWTNEQHAFLARWVHVNVAAPTEDPPIPDTTDAVVQAHCQAKWSSASVDLTLPAESPEAQDARIIAAGEHVRERIEGIRWDDRASGRFRHVEHLLASPLGTVVITDKALYFAPDAPASPAGVEAQTVRMELNSVRGTELQSFGRFHWIAIHRAGGSDQYLAASDNQDTRDVRTRLVSLIAQPDTAGADR